VRQLLHLADQSFNGLSAPDLQATPQCTKMTTAVNSGVARLELSEEFHSCLIRMLFQPLKHLRPVIRPALRTGPTPARFIAEAAVFEWPDHNAPSTRILTPPFHPLCQTIHVLLLAELVI
jgi:hypothetical protein